MIPLFPTFKKLEITDRKEIEGITSKFEPYSDYNFVSLFSWDTREEIRIARLHGNLVILFSDYISEEKYFCFIGTNRVDHTIHTLIVEAAKQNLSETLRLIPEPIIKHITHPKRYVITEDRDSFDYILSVSDLVKLEGTKYHPQRNFIKRYKTAYEAATHTKLLELSDKQIQEQILGLFYLWEKSRGKSRSETEKELHAIQKLMNHSHLLNIKALGLFINNELKGFAVNEIISDRHGVAHFEKVDLSHTGIFQYLKHESAQLFHEHGVQFMNIEQDLGIEGLRKTKLANHPVYFLKKYTIALAK